MLSIGIIISVLVIEYENLLYISTVYSRMKYIGIKILWFIKVLGRGLFCGGSGFGRSTIVRHLFKKSTASSCFGPVSLK